MIMVNVGGGNLPASIFRPPFTPAREPESGKINILGFPDIGHFGKLPIEFLIYGSSLSESQIRNW